MPATYHAVLFDLDGTLVDSYADAQDCWGEWADSMGLGNTFDLSKFYGQKRSEIIRSLLPHLPEREIEANTEAVRMAERSHVAKVVALPGVPEVLADLPSHRWGIVTSNDTEVTLARLRSAGLPVPDIIVSSDDVSQPKPHPEGFLLGAEKLGCRPSLAVAIDDSPIGITAAKNAGMTAIAVRFRHRDSELAEAHAVADNVGSIRFQAQLDGVTITVNGVQP